MTNSSALSGQQERSLLIDLPKEGKSTQGHRVNPYKITVYQTGAWSISRRTCSQAEPPEAQLGARYSETLSRLGVRRITQAGPMANLVDRPFVGFWRFSFGEAERRARLGAAELSIGGEISQFWKALRLYYEREGLPELCYAWVAENNVSKRTGLRNPHLHLLLADYLPKARLAEMWGRGFLHVDKIEKAEAAGWYMLKRAGYMSGKGKGDQGLVKGNRYGVSRQLIDRGEELEVELPQEALRGIYKLGEVARKGGKYLPVGTGIVGEHFCAGDGGPEGLRIFLRMMECMGMTES